MKSENEQLMQQARLLMEQDPDSASIVLAAVDTTLLDKIENAKYVLLMTRAKDKTDGNILTDSIALFFSRDIFIKNQDSESTSLAWFYSGKIHQLKSMFEQAGNDYIQAFDWAEKTNNQILKGIIQHNICGLNMLEGSYREALLHATKAIGFFKSVPDKPEYYINALNLTGNIFLYLSKPDSSMLYYSHAFETATQHQIVDKQRSILQNMSVAYCESGNFDKATLTCRQAIILTPSVDSIHLAQLFLNLADIFTETGRKDSTAFYINKTNEYLRNSQNSKVAAHMYEVLADMEEENGNFEKALIYHQQYVSFLESDYREQVDKKVMDISRRYDFRLVQNRLIDQKRNSRNTIIFVTVLVISGAVIIGYFINRKRLIAENKALLTEQEYQSLSDLYHQLNSQVKDSEEKRQAYEQKEQELICKIKKIEIEKEEHDLRITKLAIESEKLSNQIEFLDKDNKSFREKEEVLTKKVEFLNLEKQSIDQTVNELESQKKILSNQVEILIQERTGYDIKEKELIDQLRQVFDIVKDMVVLKDMVSIENNAADKILLKDVKGMLEGIDISSFVKYINSIQTDFARKLKETCSQLSEKEYQICCMIRFGLNKASIALILGQKSNSLNQARHDIRKKIGLKRNENLDDYLATIF